MGNFTSPLLGIFEAAFTGRAAVHDALELGAISADAVKHLALCRMERRPPRLDLSEYPHLPASTVVATNPADYMTLTTGAAS